MEIIVTVLVLIMDTLGPSGLVILLATWLVLPVTDTIADVQDDRRRRAAEE